MTESAPKDDKNDVKDDKTGGAYKEELIQEPIPEPKSTTATKTVEEFPPEFARLMDAEIALDDGALRRLWQEARAIMPDATAEELHHFFQERAKTVYRNRKLDNPTGLMLSTIRDWFSKRRVLERRKAREEDEREAAALQEQLANQLAELRSLGVLPVAARDRNVDDAGVAAEPVTPSNLKSPFTRALSRCLRSSRGKRPLLGDAPKRHRFRDLQSAQGRNARYTGP